MKTTVLGFYWMVALGLNAATITYTINATGTGTLNGTPFTNQPLTFVIVADTSTLTQADPGVFFVTPSSFAITIGGRGTVNVTDPTFVFANQIFAKFGFGTNSDRSQFISPTFSSYGLTPTGPITPTCFGGAVPPCPGSPATVSNWASQPVNTTGGQMLLTAYTGTQTITASDQTTSGLRFVPVVPCRVADTRNPAGALGGPILAGQQTRDFPVPSSTCGIPGNAAAYSLNVTVVPSAALGYLTLWPSGQPRPFVSTLNSFDGRIKANAALVPAGASGRISVFVTDETHVVLDINGFFVGQGGPPLSSLVLYPLPPCRVADTRLPSGTLGGPTIEATQTRVLPILDSGCGVPPTAKAYSLNITAVPQGPLSYLTTWPAGQPQPFVSTLNAFTGTVVANAAIVPAGANGAISVFATNRTDLIVDIGGYFAPPGAPGGLDFVGLSPCRLVDTRNPPAPLGGPDMAAGVSRSFPLATGSCNVPPSASMYSLNATVVPQTSLGFLTLWPTGQVQPFTSTLNSFDGSIVSNAALVPAGMNAAISAIVTNPTSVILDINGYFALDSQPLVTPPTPVTPVNGSVFNHFPRTTTLTWTPVSGATQYGVQVQYCQPGFIDCVRWQMEIVSATTYTFNFVGAQPGRWRVWAIDSATGSTSAVSAWSTFFYTI